MIDIKINQKVHLSSLESTQLLIDHLKSRKPYSDSLDAHFGIALGSTMFLSDDAAYTSLQVFGRELISNEDIRKELSVLYAHDYKFVKELEEIDADMLTVTLQPFYSKHFRDFRLFQSATPIDYIFLLNDPQYLGHLEWWRSNRLYTNSRYNLIREKVDEIISLIDKQLEERV